MKDKNLDDELDINKFIPASQLGIPSSEFTIDPNVFFKEVYEMYYDTCHSEEAGDASDAYEKVTTYFKQKRFAVRGKRGMFHWKAISALYPPDVHKITPEKQMQNNFYDALTLSDGFHLGEILCDTINNEYEFNYLLRSPLVVDIIELMTHVEQWFISNTHTMNYILTDFFSQEEPLVMSKDAPLSYFKNKIKGKDVILPFEYITELVLKGFPKIAKEVLIEKCKANTVTVIGLCRLIPSITGKYGQITRLPRISNMRINLFSLLNAINKEINEEKID